MVSDFIRDIHITACVNFNIYNLVGYSTVVVVHLSVVFSL